MADDIADSRIVEWIRELFSGADAESMFRWMLAAWIVAVVAMIVLDRVSTALLGRSQPLLQRPPAKARTWRWRRIAPPTNFSRLPSGTLVTPLPSAAPKSIPLSSANYTEDAHRVIKLSLPAGDLPDHFYWESLASIESPVFGYENNSRLELGRAPERYNPISGQIEELDRDNQSVSWPNDGPELVVIDFSDSATE